LPQNRLENGTGAPQLAQGSTSATPQFRHCRLSAGFEAPHVRQSMGTTGNALIDGPEPTPLTIAAASKMCAAAKDSCQLTQFRTLASCPK
jgi:hypothetical protein